LFVLKLFEMNKFRPLILALAIVASALLAYGLFTLPEPQPADAEGFSAVRVVKDIEIISKEHHSVAHPEERAAVREYLVGRLGELGADTVQIFRYDSLVGPKNKHVEYVFDAYDILAEYPPLKASEDTTYLMFIAHYDSRYSQPFAKDTVWSYGAADDGYGLGITLETVSQLLKQREHWNQGVKVLFTDAEEVGMMGMSAIWENDRQEFDNVGFVINIEARGPWGPALLFEACPGNKKVLDLYASAAKYPYAYSLTTVVYQFMPNFTDFTIIKDEIPGLNFSTITDVNRYHTHFDNFSNVSEKSIQHYGEQILPIALKYVKSEEYSDKNALKADSDYTNFTIPAVGLLNFSKTGFMIFNVAVFLVFLLIFGLEGIRGRVKAAKVFKVSCVTLGSALGFLALGELIAFVCGKIAGVQFKPFGIMQGIMFDNAAMIVSMVIMTLVCIVVYISRRTKIVRAVSGSMRASAIINAATHNAYNVLYGVLSLVFILSVALLLSIGETLMFIIPLCCATVAMVLYHLTNLRLWLPVAIVLILLHAFSFYYALAMALTIGALGAVMMLAFFDIMVIIPLADLYLMPVRKK
jgi:hypothetical protein